MLDPVDRTPGPQRRPLQRTRQQVLDDLAWLCAQGVTEVVFDLNLSPHVGFPDVDPGAAVRYVERVLHAFAPVRH
ncbi:MAG TPA: hypothetical protein VFN68_03740 [Acidimicrobiales bacterium]|nr:hypothetical protein [Acidimicrobiales bacterium]